MSARARRPQPRGVGTSPAGNRLAWGAVLCPLLPGALVYARTVTFDFSFLDDAFLKDHDFSNLGNIPRAFRTLYVLGTYYRPLVTVSYIVWTKRSPNGSRTLQSDPNHMSAMGELRAAANRPLKS